MKKALAVVLMLAVNLVFAEDWTNPDAKFNATKKMSSKVNIEWQTVDNIQATCERESRARGLGGFGYPVQACSFWQGNTCNIFTPASTSLHSLGHETRHCFQGNYH
ncbi:hypothetical protein UFOVP181_192 [uncultured Caudovirales phage]|uniref:Uncharacterized protein n=1 Tax=uncultured Caudovirales phage TaxID=2100421 RepID=A0A6J5KYI1_9CAUD|nr:hypothetical protein UFOVP57_447 [uncultured Caudovirales phage]CAB5208806.1 hypothetical protein UFOVP181_192 [uncultured Caudovirales phage]